MTKIEFETRPMNPAEAESLSRSIVGLISGLTYYNEFARASEIAKYSAGDLLDSIREDSDSILVAVRASEILGFCINKYDDGLLWLSWIAVLPGYRGRGIAEKLLGRMEESAKARGIHKIWCDSRTVNESAKALLSKIGYRQLCTVENHWYGQDFILWEKPLT